MKSVVIFTVIDIIDISRRYVSEQLLNASVTVVGGPLRQQVQSPCTMLTNRPRRGQMFCCSIADGQLKSKDVHERVTITTAIADRELMRSAVSMSNNERSLWTHCVCIKLLLSVRPTEVTQFVGHRVGQLK